MTADAVQTTSKWLTDIYAPLDEEVTAFDLPVEGTIPLELEGRFLRNGPNPLGPCRTWRRTTGSRATGWSTGCACATVAPSGTELAGCARRRSASPRRGAGARRATRRVRHRQHQRGGTRRPDVRPRRGRGAAGRALLRSRHARALRLQRHAAQRLHRPPEGRSVDRRPARHRLPLGDPAPAVHRRRVPTPGSARWSRSRSPTVRWCMTARSPSVGWSSTTSPSRSTSMRR